jgi:hypothetical protein
MFESVQAARAVVRLVKMAIPAGFPGEASSSEVAYWISIEFATGWVRDRLGNGHAASTAKTAAHVQATRLCVHLLTRGCVLTAEAAPREVIRKSKCAGLIIDDHVDLWGDKRSRNNCIGPATKHHEARMSPSKVGGAFAETFQQHAQPEASCCRGMRINVQRPVGRISVRLNDQNALFSHAARSRRITREEHPAVTRRDVAPFALMQDVHLPRERTILDAFHDGDGAISRAIIHKYEQCVIAEAVWAVAEAEGFACLLERDFLIEAWNHDDS